ncbi:NAD(P)/FAD-dependent oxidoreductase [Natrinema gelatinilyticum]|uniref:NAD(P)/FAD-dependent oxidoreductase n=1 Tax=Natrinema gelatinilyticum TaxID=2961571 RepID=UPI0020C271E2|nr:FAD-binding oxidoreductase [Natrinema gelatinilyticum]
MQVTVVGGGIVGLSSAYYLARGGADVTLCEKGSLGMGSTARSAGGIRTQFSTAVNVELSLRSLEVWDSFHERFDVDIAHKRNGYLLVTGDEETAERYREDVKMQNELGAESQFITPEEAKEHSPGLEIDDLVAATYNGQDGFADPNLAVQGYAAKAREEGVDIRTKTAVTDVHTDGDAITGVETDEERINADFVVNAAGAWSRTVADMAGVDLPIHPRRRQLAVVDPQRILPQDVPLTINLDTGSYFRPERDGVALVGGHFSDDPDIDIDRYSDSLDIEWAATAVEQAAEYTAYFGGDSRIRRGWAGLYAVTPDHHPIIEETVPGLVTAAGFSGHGFQHSPATGQLVAELILDGEPSLVDISSLSSSRFEDDTGLVEHNVV